MNFIMRRKCRNPRFTRKFSSGSRAGAFGIHQTFIQKSSKNVQKTRSDFALIFYRFFMKKNLPKSCKKPSQKASQNPSKNLHIFSSIFHWFWDPKWLQNRSQNPPKNELKKNYKKTSKKWSQGRVRPSLAWERKERGSLWSGFVGFLEFAWIHLDASDPRIH